MHPYHLFLPMIPDAINSITIQNHAHRLTARKPSAKANMPYSNINSALLNWLSRVVIIGISFKKRSRVGCPIRGSRETCNPPFASRSAVSRKIRILHMSPEILIFQQQPSRATGHVLKMIGPVRRETKRVPFQKLKCLALCRQAHGAVDNSGMAETAGDRGRRSVSGANVQV